VTHLILNYLRKFDQPETIPTTLVMSLIKSYKGCRYREQEIIKTLNDIVIKKMRHEGRHDEQLVFFAFNRLSFMSFDTTELESEIVSRGFHLRIHEPQNMVMFLHSLAIRGSFDLENVWTPCLKSLLCDVGTAKYRESETYNRTLALTLELFELAQGPAISGELNSLVAQLRATVNESTFTQSSFRISH